MICLNMFLIKNPVLRSMNSTSQECDEKIFKIMGLTPPLQSLTVLIIICCFSSTNLLDLGVFPVSEYQLAGLIDLIGIVCCRQPSCTVELSGPANLMRVLIVLCGLFQFSEWILALCQYKAKSR